MGFNIIWLAPDRFDLKPNKSPWLEMSKALTEKGHAVTILTSKSKNPKKNHLDNGDSVKYLEAIDLPFIFRFSVLFKMFFWLKRYASANDVIIANHETLFLVPFLKRIGLKKIHLDFRTLPVDTHTKKDHLDRLLFWYAPLKFLGHSVNSYSFITERLKQEVVREFNLKVEDYVIWQSGVSTSVFYPIESDKNTNAFRLFYHGTVTINRGIGLAIQALTLIDETLDIEFIIVGDGSGLEELKELVKDNKLLRQRIVFKGLLPYENMVKEINLADICICPLTDRLEWNVSSPIKVFEYMACGKPMILTPISAHKDVAGDAPYIVWTDGYAPSDFRDAIMTSIQNYGDLKKCAKLAPNFVNSNFQWKNQAHKLANYLSHTMCSE